SAAAVLVANKVPGGGEAIEKTLTGSILWVTFKPTIIKLAVVYAALGLFHYALRHRFLTISFHPEEAERLGWRIKWWDFLFYLSFGVVITLAVPVAGVLMVFSFLVVPAVIAFLFTRDMKRLAYISRRPRALRPAPRPPLSRPADLRAVFGAVPLPHGPGPPGPGHAPSSRCRAPPRAASRRADGHRARPRPTPPPAPSSSDALLAVQSLRRAPSPEPRRTSAMHS